jgi:hypothetical protein
VKRLGCVVALALGVAAPRVGAAQDVAARLDGRVPAAVVQAVRDIAQGAAARGVPVEPLIQKAIEGGAKGVPADRVITAVRLLATRLDAAHTALRDAGIARPGAEAVESGADALNAGLSAAQVRALARMSQPPYDPSVTLRVAATLAALGVPATTVLALLEDHIKAGRSPSELLSLPSDVQADMARGATPAQAAQGLGHAAAHEPRTRPPHDAPPGRPPHKP